MLSPPGKDVFFEEAKLELGRNFTNKLWQASRLILGAVEKEAQPLFRAGGDEAAKGLDASLAFAPAYAWEDRWILSALARCATDTNRCFEEWRMNEGTTRLYDFFWHDFCDWYLELAKVRLYGEGDKRTVLAVLVHVLGESLKLMHPLMPYITEEIASYLPTARGRLLLEQAYPRGDDVAIDPDAEGRMAVLKDVVTSVRNVRAAYRVNPGARIPVRVRATGPKAERVREASDGITRLAGVAALEVGPDVVKEKGSAATPIGDIEVVIPLAGIVDIEGERARLTRERGKVEAELGDVERKLSNQGFVAKAKPEVVERERARQERLNTELAKLVESLGLLGG
jgi:valyl-tRNA synthetase